MESRARVRRVTQRLGQVYSRIKQVIAVVPGVNHRYSTLNQKIFVSKSTARNSMTFARRKSRLNRQ
jgi:hypothetical protein